jgi:hypothetical protein
MKITKMVEISEIISSAAIVISLVVLIFEIRANTEETRAATLTNIAGRTQAFTIAHMTNPQVEKVWNQLTFGEVASDADTGLVRSLIIAALKVAEESYIAYRDGRLEGEVWETRATLALAAMKSDRARELWKSGLRYNGTFIREFDEWLDAALTERHGE